ncbi:MAG: hypothetical protein QM610_08090 [Chitinophagaceae bacterium]
MATLNLDLNAMGLTSMTEAEMETVDGGLKIPSLTTLAIGAAMGFGLLGLGYWAGYFINQ